MKKSLLYILLFLGLTISSFSFDYMVLPLPDPPEGFTPMAADAPGKLPPSARESTRLAIFALEDTTKLQNGTVFLGDSITEGFKLDKYFPGEFCINRGITGEGIGGFKRFGTLNRLESTVYNLNPKRIILLIGGNDTPMLSADTADKKLLQYDYLVWKIRHDLPNADLWCIGLLPTAKKYAYLNPRQLAFNIHAKQVAAKYGAHWVEILPSLTNDSGEFKTELTREGLHPSVAGYDIIAKIYNEQIFKKSTPSEAVIPK